MNKLTVTTSVGTMTFDADALPSVDDLNTLIDAAVEAHNPTTHGMSEDAAEDHRIKNESTFIALCEASTALNPHLTNEQFYAACCAWLKKNA